MEQIVGSYRIGSEIGRGSFATVYKGHNTVSFLCFVVFAFSSLASGAVVRGVVLFADKPIATLERCRQLPRALWSCLRHPQHNLSSLFVAGQLCRS
jgi:serine/threonine protein kinase